MLKYLKECRAFGLCVSVGRQQSEFFMGSQIELIRKSIVIIIVYVRSCCWCWCTQMNKRKYEDERKSGPLEMESRSESAEAIVFVWSVCVVRV